MFFYTLPDIERYLKKPKIFTTTIRNKIREMDRAAFKIPCFMEEKDRSNTMDKFFNGDYENAKNEIEKDKKCINQK
ncbi:MAG: hypothetical protein U1F68_01920 [Gammaproteobacteria bacterium]